MVCNIIPTIQYWYQRHSANIVEKFPCFDYKLDIKKKKNKR